jgi:TatD DNase family protein
MVYAENEGIDSHSHIYLPEFDTDREAMLERARQEGIQTILMPAIDSETHSLLFAQEKQAPGHCLAMMGLHPCSVKANYREELKIAHQYLETRTFCGIGEIGLDFYWDKTFITEQYEALEQQLAWALEFDLAFSLHSRNATDECIEVVSKYQNGKLRGVFHCFSGNEEQARKITDLGLYLGIGGVVTFKNGGLDKILPGVGLDKIVLETDAPYLAPVPFRGKRNEPAYLKFIIEKIANIKNASEEEVRKTTSGNAKNIFKV